MAAKHTSRSSEQENGASGALSAPVRVVVVDPLPLFRAGTVAALDAGRVKVVGEAAHVARGIELARSTQAAVLLLGDVPVEGTRQAAAAWPSCSVVALVSQPTRDELVEVLGAGVAGVAPRSLTAEHLVAAVEAAGRASAQSPAGTGGSSDRAAVFLPLSLRSAAPAIGQADAGGDGGRGGERLTRKESEVLAHLARGASNKQIAEALYVTPATVKTHLAHIYAKLGARGRREAVPAALARGLLK
ncbi:MAG: response regulator transcription factor [Acidimicrobiales bacterium]